MFGGFDDIIGNHMQRMNNMMGSLFGMPVGGMGNDLFGQNVARQGRSQSMSLMPFDNDMSSMGMMTPFGFPNMQHMMRSMSQMSNDPNCHSFSSSSVMSMTTGPDGKPQVYQASSSTRQAPGGIRETKKTLCDSRSGVKKMSIGHHIGDRGHVKEKEQNLFTGQLEENDEYINLEEEEEPEFSKEWQTKAQQHYRPRSSHQAIGYHHQPSARHLNNSEQLALPPAPSAESDGNNLKDGNNLRDDNNLKGGSNLKEDSHQRKKSHRSKPYDKRKEKPAKKEKDE